MAARCKRGETFAIAIAAMVEQRVLGWCARKYREARDLLLEAGFIREVQPARPPHRAAEYALCERALTPVLAW